MLPSIGNEIVKAVVAQFNAEQLLTQRDRVSKAVRLGLSVHCMLSKLIKEAPHAKRKASSPVVLYLCRYVKA